MNQPPSQGADPDHPQLPDHNGEQTERFDHDELATPAEPPTQTFDPQGTAAGSRDDAGHQTPVEAPATGSFGYEPTAHLPLQSQGDHDQPAAAPTYLPGEYGGPSEPDQQRRSPAIVVIAVIAAVAIVGALAFGAFQLFGGQEEPVGGPTDDATEEPIDEGTDDGATATEDEGNEGDGTGEEPTEDATQDTDATEEEVGGDLYAYLTSDVEVVEGENSVWTIDDEGWTPADVSADGVDEAYSAAFTSADGETLELEVVSFGDYSQTGAYGGVLVDANGDSDETGPVWDDPDATEQEQGVYHMWLDSQDVEIVWWDDINVVRNLVGTGEGAIDFYRHVRL